MIRNLASAALTGALVVGLLLLAIAKPQIARTTNPLAATVIVTGGPGQGSGFHIGGGIIITAAHVVGAVGELDLRTSGGFRFKGRVLQVDPVYDVAVILGSTESLPHVSMPCADAGVGESIIAYGTPAGVEFLQFAGRVAGSARHMGPWRLVQVGDYTLAGGMSGGPVANGKNEAVGITVGALAYGMGLLPIATFVPASVVCRITSSI